MISHLRRVVGFSIAITLALALTGCQSGAVSRTSNQASLAESSPASGVDRLGLSSQDHGTVALGAMASRGASKGLPGRLGVMSFNMEHRDNPDQLAVMANQLKTDLDEVPDFILLQEVVFGRSTKAGADNTAAVLGNLLGYSCEGTKRTSDHEGIAILSRYPFVYYASKNLKSQTSAFLLGFRRVSVMGEFMVPLVGRVRVVNVHLTNWGFEAHVRYKQIEETLQWITDRELEVPADLTILGGDFNSDPGDNEMRLVTEAISAGRLQFQNFNTTQPTRGSHGNPSQRIDYIFIASAHGPLQIAASGEQRLWLNGLQSTPGGRRFWPSDHVPVLHEYIINPKWMANSTARFDRDLTARHTVQ